MTDTSGARDSVVSYAREQLGKPYVFGASGPNSFDCSGLTMRSWESAGFTLPHYTVAQYSSVSKVPLSQALPGDLVFFGGFNPAMGMPHHVGIFVAPSSMIDAPDYGIPVGVHDYNGYGDVMSEVGRLPVNDSNVSATLTDVSTTTTVATPSSLTSSLGDIPGYISKITSGGLWKRVGLGALGVLIIVLMAKWVGHSG